jgi:hypothetical protein
MRKMIVGGLAAAAVAGGLAFAAPAPTHAEDFLFDVCPYQMDGVVTGTPTSCAFADNVRRGYFAQGGPEVIAFSPVTNAYYDMHCYNHFTAHFTNGSSRFGVLCTGGIGAAVVIW